MMTPAPDFLQALSSARMDVLFLFASRRRYENGMRGLGDTFDEGVAGIARVVHRMGYRRTVAVGSSGGTAAALFSAPELRPRTLTLFGPANMQSDRRPYPWEELVDRWRRMRSSGDEPLKVTLVVGTESAGDLANASVIRAAMGGTVLEVPGAAHVVVEPLLLERRLPGLLRSVVPPGPPTEEAPS
jgi:hypothetical protein